MSQSNKVTITVEPMRPDVWRLRINTSTYDAAGKRIGRDQKYATIHGTREQAEAERWKRLLSQGVAEAAKPEAQINRDVSADVAVRDMTLGEYAEGWLERRLLQALEGQTARDIKALIRLYVLPAFGHLKLRTLCKDQILEGFLPLVHGGAQGVGNSGRYTGRSGRALAPRTIRHALIKLMAIVTEASEAGLCSLKACDFRAVKKALPRTVSHKNKVRAKAMSQEQTDRLLDAVKGHWLGPVIRFALASGCRRGEMCALQWNAIEFKGADAASVSIHQSLADDSRRAWVKRPKTDASVRSVVIAGPIVSELAMMKTEAARIAKALRMDVGALPVFPNTRGNMMDPGDLSDNVHTVMVNAGLRGFSLHSTRHTHASTLLRNGFNIAAVSQRLGHTSAAFTVQVYGWAMPSEDILLAQGMAAAMMGGSRAVSLPAFDEPEGEDEELEDEGEALELEDAA